MPPIQRLHVSPQRRARGDADRAPARAAESFSGAPQPVLDAPWLEAWLVVRALEHDNEHLLLTLALGHLRQHGILRPGIVELERLVGALAE